MNALHLLNIEDLKESFQKLENFLDTLDQTEEKLDYLEELGNDLYNNYYEDNSTFRARTQSLLEEIEDIKRWLD